MLRRYVVAAAAVRTCSVLQEVFLCLQFVLQALGLLQSDGLGPDLEPCSNSCSGAAGFHTALCYVTAVGPTAGGDDGGDRTGTRSGNIRIRTHYCYCCIQVIKSVKTYKS